MIALHEGELHETARERLSSYGYNLDSLTWDESHPNMEIGYRHNGFSIFLDVRGLPQDIPTNVFDELLTNLIKTELRGVKKVSVSKDTIVYIKNLKAKRMKEGN